jgi:lysine-N-methylase
MKPLFAPNYYHRFRCIAAACKHSCCVGWEIDVDGDALSRYDALQGSMGDRLRACIDREADPPCFILTEGERCPFLRESGLCDLICELGEESLCHICADHPRFRNIRPDRVELGLGLCCEAAARLILSQTEYTEVEELSSEEAARDRFAYEEAEENEGSTQLGLRIRDHCLHIGQNRRYPMGERTNFMVTGLGYGRSYPDLTFAEWAEILLETEELDPARRELFASLATLTDSPDMELMEERGLPYEKLLCYFLYRYLANEGRDFMEWGYLIRIGLAILSTILIHAMARATGKTSFEELCEIARIYSSEIEYSEENLDCLWDIIREDTVQPPKDRHE